VSGWTLTVWTMRVQARMKVKDLVVDKSFSREIFEAK
jgi:hypothetical protein